MALSLLGHWVIPGLWLVFPFDQVGSHSQV